MGHAALAPGRRKGVQEVFSDEAADEARSPRETESQSERQNGFWHRRGRVKGFWRSFGTVGAKWRNLELGVSRKSLVFSEVMEPPAGLEPATC